MHKSQHPKMGPFYGLQAIANCDKFNWNFSFILIEKRKDFIDLSSAQCFEDEFHRNGVYPPIIFPNYVWTNTTVLPALSQILWKFAVEKLC